MGRKELEKEKGGGVSSMSFCWSVYRQNGKKKGETLPEDCSLLASPSYGISRPPRKGGEEKCRSVLPVGWRPCGFIPSRSHGQPEKKKKKEERRVAQMALEVS